MNPTMLNLSLRYFDIFRFNVYIGQDYGGQILLDNFC